MSAVIYNTHLLSSLLYTQHRIWYTVTNQRQRLAETHPATDPGMGGDRREMERSRDSETSPREMTQNRETELSERERGCQGDTDRLKKDKHRRTETETEGIKTK